MNTSLTKTCSFFGHRKIENSTTLKSILLETVENLIITENCNTFLFGGFGEFDELAFRAVNELKSKYYNISTIFCYSNEKDKKSYLKRQVKLEQKFDKYLYLPLKFDYWYYRIFLRNIEIVNTSDFVITYVTHTENSGAYKIKRYAEKQKKMVINIKQ